MIRGYQRFSLLPPEDEGRFQWPAALKAGIIAGLILLLVARGNPWAGLTFSSPVVMGRVIPAAEGIPLAAVWLIHLLVSLCYGVIISLAVARLTHFWAIITGGIVGVVLYFVNWAVVLFCLPVLKGNEAGVLFTHIVFGLIAGGAYRGLLKRQALPAGR